MRVQQFGAVADRSQQTFGCGRTPLSSFVLATDSQPTAYCLLPSAYCLMPNASQSWECVDTEELADWLLDIFPRFDAGYVLAADLGFADIRKEHFSRFRMNSLHSSLSCLGSPGEVRLSSVPNPLRSPTPTPSPNAIEPHRREPSASILLLLDDNMALALWPVRQARRSWSCGSCGSTVLPLIFARPNFLPHSIDTSAPAWPGACSHCFARCAENLCRVLRRTVCSISADELQQVSPPYTDAHCPASLHSRTHAHDS